MLLAVSLFGAEVDFSGTWNLVVPKSEFGGAKPPLAQEMVVHQKGDGIAVHATLTTDAGAAVSDYRLNATGKSVQNAIRGNNVTSIATWRGPSLYIRSSTSVQGNDVKMVDQWQLDDNGKRLTIYRSASTPQGDVEQKFVYAKYAAKP